VPDLADTAADRDAPALGIPLPPGLGDLEGLLDDPVQIHRDEGLVASDAGKPIVLTDPASPTAQAFIKAAEQLAAQVSIRAMQGELTPQIKVSF